MSIGFWVSSYITQMNAVTIVSNQELGAIQMIRFIKNGNESLAELLKLSHMTKPEPVKNKSTPACPMKK